MTIIGGVGTLIGPDAGRGRAAAARLLAERHLRTALAAHLSASVYVLLVLFLPYGIVGTWQLRRNDIRAGWRRLLQPLQGQADPTLPRRG